MTHLTLLRHSISEANEAGICDSGRFDAALSQNGRILAEARATRMKNCPDIIYTSDMKRAFETAHIYKQALKKNFGKDVNVIPLPTLCGQDNGLLEGLSFTSDEYKFLTMIAPQNGFADFGGESNATAGRRQLKAFLDIAHDAEKNGYQNALVVTHSDAILWFQMAIRTPPLKPKPPKNCQRLGPFDTHKIISKISEILTPPQKKPVPKRPGTPPAP